MLKNRKNLTRVLVVLCIAAITACASVVFAGVGGCEHGRGHHRGFIFKKLGLTDAQKAQAKAIFQANKAVVKPLVTSLRTERKNLQTLIHAATVDEAAIRAESATIAGIQANLNVNRAQVGVQFRAILTPAQLATLQTLEEKHSAPPAPED